jgi:hypothetical protein
LKNRKENIKKSGKIKTLFVAGFGPIVRNNVSSKAMYAKSLGIPFKEEDGGYLHTDKLPGVNHFALWPLSQAASSCFGKEQWPKKFPVPQAWLEFDVEDVEAATRKMKKRGYEMLVSARKEPWGQIVTRFLSPEGLLVGITYTPWMRKREKAR